MTTTSIRKGRGFTLVELLVVMSIISLLSSIVMSNISTARAKSVDVKKTTDLSEARTALSAFHLDNQTMPHNYDCAGANCTINDSRTTLAIEDTANPENPQTESGKAYRASMMELVDGKYISSVPHSPGGAGYVYYNYGSGSAAGAVIGTTLDTVQPSITGEAGSCRPFGVIVSMQEPPPGGGAAAGGLGGADGGGICIVVENGMTQEYPRSDPRCNGAGGGTGGGPTQGPNLCSPNSSKDYCLCVKY